MTQNRPMKFRAYIKNINKMVEVNEINWCDNLYEKGNISSIRYVGETYVHHYLEFDPNNTVLMQYTGYEDKNDVEIYEGDIVEYYDELFEIKWMLGGFYMRDFKKGGFLEVATSERYMEVVGNIYKNPELLEDKKER